MKNNHLCAVAIGRTMDELIHRVHLAQKEADLVEARIDFLSMQKDIDLTPLGKSVNKSIILTCRRKDEGGRWNGDETIRLSVIQQAFKLEFAFVDVELRTLEEGRFVILSDSKSKVIVSFHDFAKTPPIPELKKIMERMQIFEPTIKKIATMINKKTDSNSLFQLILDKKEGERVCIIGMGELGRKVRIISPLFGGDFTYCSINNMSSAPGQISCSEMKKIYRLIL